MRKYLGILQSGLRFLVIKSYILAILSGYKPLYKIYYVFKKKSRYSIVVKKLEDVKSVNDKIYA